MKDVLTRVIREFSSAIINPYDLEDLLHRLTRQSSRVLDASGCGLMLEDRTGRLSFAAASEHRIVEVSLHQQQVNEGTCCEAYATNRLLAIRDVRAYRPQWPSYAERVLDAGLSAVMGAPMNAFGHTIGVLTVYRSVPTTWDDHDIEAIEIMAAMGAGYIVHAHELRAQHDLTEHLQVAINSRDLIGQAKGIIMAREEVTADEAFAILRTTSQRSNRKLHDVARLVIENRIGLARPQDSGPRTRS